MADSKRGRKRTTTRKKTTDAKRSAPAKRRRTTKRDDHLCNDDIVGRSVKKLEHEAGKLGRKITKIFK